MKQKFIFSLISDFSLISELLKFPFPSGLLPKLNPKKCRQYSKYQKSALARIDAVLDGIYYFHCLRAAKGNW